MSRSTQLFQVDDYTLIYTSAKNSDVRKLEEISTRHYAKPPTRRINTIQMTPLFQLASEGRNNAVNLLIKHKFEIGDAVAGYAYGGFHNEVDELIRTKNQAFNLEAYAVRGYALRGNVEKVNALIENDEGLAKIACEAYAMSGQTIEVNRLLRKYKVSQDFALTGYALGGHHAQVNDLINRGASIERAHYYYLNGGHEGLAQQLLVRSEYQKQVAAEKFRIKLIVLFAIILTPLSLLVSLPLFFWKRNTAPIQLLEATDEQISHVRNIRNELKIRVYAKDINKECSSKVHLGKVDDKNIMLVDKPKFDRFKLFQNQSRLIAPKKLKPLKEYFNHSKKQSLVTHQWLRTGQGFAEETRREEYSEYMATPRLD